jgi:hypothetical protein
MPRARAQRSIHIKAAAEDVYDFAVGDLSSLADWLTSVQSVDEVDPKWPALGASYVYSRAVERRSLRGRTTIVEAHRPRRVVMREELLLDEPTTPGQSDDARTGRSVWTFEPERGGTRVTMEAVGIEMSTLTYLIWRVLLSGKDHRKVQDTLAGLKRICEQELEDAPEESSG